MSFINDNIDDIDDEKMDADYKIEFMEQTKQEINENIQLVNTINMFSDIRSYLEKNALIDELFKNITIEKVQQL
tara:strand:- start:398 stop:619 length:222 start_codon:yes stop_codon:yes gene_type:complete